MASRVAYIAFEPFPNAKGSGTRICATVGALVDAGFEVDLVTLRGGDELEVPPGVRLHPIALYERNFLVRALAFRDAVGRRLEALRPDIVHFRGIFEGQAALSFAQRSGAPAVFEANGLPSVELQYHYPSVGKSMQMLTRLRELEAQTLAAADVVLTQSQTTLGFLRGRGLPERTPAHVIPNGANPPQQTGRWVSRPRARVLYAGTLSPWQGVSELLMAARRCARERDIEFVLAGPVRRRWRTQLERHLRRLNVESHVSIAGALGRASLAEQMLDADICVAPLRRDTRNKTQGCSPIKLYEYMASARPVIATDLPCVREIVDDDRGILVSTPRPKVLAEQILSTLEDAPGRQAMGLTARAWVRDNATWAHRREEIQAVYSGLLGSRS